MDAHAHYQVVDPHEFPELCSKLDTIDPLEVDKVLEIFQNPEHQSKTLRRCKETSTRCIGTSVDVIYHLPPRQVQQPVFVHLHPLAPLWLLDSNESVFMQRHCLGALQNAGLHQAVFAQLLCFSSLRCVLVCVGGQVDGVVTRPEQCVYSHHAHRTGYVRVSRDDVVL